LTDLAQSATERAAGFDVDAGLEEVLRACRNPSALASSVAVGLTWAGIWAVLLAAAAVDSLIFALPAVLLLGGLQHRFFTIYHDAFHRTLYGNRAVNDFVGRWFAAYPTLSRYDEPRNRHLAHHRWTATANDPEYVSDAQSWRELLPTLFPWPSMLLRMIRSFLAKPSPAPAPAATGQPAEPAGSFAQYRKSLPELLNICLTQIIILAVALLAGIGWWILLYWVALALVLPILTGVRQFVEHRPGHDAGADARYVVTQANWFERFFFAPMHFNLHEAHHRFPYISFCWLPTLQSQLLAARTGGVIHGSYCTVLFRNLRW
jgi:fatty acid desaturase